MNERSTMVYTCTLQDEDGEALALANIDSLKLTLYDKATGNTINSRYDQDVIIQRRTIHIGGDRMATHWVGKFKEIQPGNYYRMRNGDVAYVAGINPNDADYPVLGWRIVEGQSTMWTLHGRWLREGVHGHDLVELIGPECPQRRGY